MRIAIAAALFSTTVAAATFLHREKPPAAHTGGFGEPTCAICHLPDDSDPPAHSLRLVGLPDSYEPGKRYPITVELSATRLRVGGFQLSARQGEGTQRGRQAGTFAVDSTRIARTRVDSTGIEYVSHNQLSMGAKRDSLRWQLIWIAPATRGAVDFHLAANISDDDASPLGDYILTRTFRLQPLVRK